MFTSLTQRIRQNKQQKILADLQHSVFRDFSTGNIPPAEPPILAYAAASAPRGIPMGAAYRGAEPVPTKAPPQRYRSLSAGGVGPALGAKPKGPPQAEPMVTRSVDTDATRKAASPKERRPMYMGIEEGTRWKGAEEERLDFILGGSDEPIAPPMPIIPKKPEHIAALEELLEIEYGTSVEVMSIESLPATRKQVKRIFFHMKDGFYQVWLFKANKDTTARELCIYDVAFKNGVPTGKPIGWDAITAKETYPFDTAVLGGGIVEHAGDPYKSLLQKMVFGRQRIFKTAQSIVSMIADYHLQLTAARQQLEDRSVTIENADPRKEIKDRFLSALRIPERDAKNLMDASVELYGLLLPVLVLSHGDPHTSNIVTRLEYDPRAGERISDSKFGVIDWGSLTLDTIHGDVTDFWIHHRRLASEVTGNNYPYTIMDVMPAYQERFNERGKQLGITFDLEMGLFEKDIRIQSTLWNVYELVDPVRTDPHDIRAKAVYHLRELANDVRSLRIFSETKDLATTIWDEVSNLTHGKL